ncbi:MAG: HAD family hydrolase [Anaerovoracaceae bacterium]|nr:HAD family hydrolase [Anaerovoracaceae bacterium]
MYSRNYDSKIELVVFDTAGTFCDGPGDLSGRWPMDDGKGCKAPVIPFYELFREEGIECSWELIRKPMGTYKPTHLKMLLDEPEISSQWEQKYGRHWDEKDFERLLARFRTLLSAYIVDTDLARPIDGAKECIDRLRAAGILVGCDTGYFAADAEALGRVLEEDYGMTFDVSSNAEKVPGRPSPFMIYDCMRQAYDITKKAVPCESVVKVDDTTTGIICGNNAGAWTVGVYASGSNDYDELALSQPDFLVPDISYVPDIVFTQIEQRLRAGEKPGERLRGRA